jgi:crotonobetainyl-CoA:carnitine CoA-transferase CaiB-like acyl-CoA transferase
MLLAELGAEVIKVENGSAGGDPSRSVGPYFLGEQDSLYFQSWNLNKRSVALDLKSDSGMEQFRKLVAEADGVVNNLRGHLPAKLGITYDDLKNVNPAIVCLHISAYGRGNERERWPGYDFLMQAETGLMSLSGEPDGPPARAGASVIDTLTGTVGVVGLLSGILQARATGKGCDIDTCLFDVALHQHVYLGSWHLNEGFDPGRMPRNAHASLAPVQTFPTSDGWIFVMCMTDQFWTKMCQKIGFPELLNAPLFATQEQRRLNLPALMERLDAIFIKRTMAEWVSLLEGVVPVAPVNTLKEAFENPFLEQAGLIGSIDHPRRDNIKVVSGPLKVNGQRLQQRACAPLGADNKQLLDQGEEQ